MCTKCSDELIPVNQGAICLTEIKKCGIYNTNGKCNKCVPEFYLDDTICVGCALETCYECNADACLVFKPAQEICVINGGVWLDDACVQCPEECKTCGTDLMCLSCHEDLVLDAG